MQTKSIAAVSAVVFGLGTALMGTTALSQATSPSATNDPLLQQGQAGAQTGTEDPALQQDQADAQTDATDDPLLQQDQAGTGTDQPATGTDQTGTGMAQPGTGTDQPATGTAQTGTGTDQPATGTAQTGTGTDQPATGTAQTGTGTDQPATGTAQTGTGTAQTDTGMAQTGSGMPTDDGLPRRSVGMAGEPYTGEVLAGVTADELIGMNVVDAAGDNVGSVNDLLFGNENQVDHAIVDVGGFLGFGAKSVALPIEDLQVSPDQDQVIVNLTREQLDAMPEWQRGDEGWLAN